MKQRPLITHEVINSHKFSAGIFIDVAKAFDTAANGIRDDALL